MSSVTPLSEDALNRYRITHSDKDIRHLLKRLHRLATSSSDPSTSKAAFENVSDREREVEMLKLELLKWKAGVERIVGSAENLKRQKDTYVEKRLTTERRKEELGKTLEGEKVELSRKLREREGMIRCDEIAKKILARGKTRVELDEQIADLQQSVEDHRTSHAVYLDTAQTRIDLFAQIVQLVDVVRSTKLPIEPQSTLPEEPAEGDGTGMEVDVDDSPSKERRLSGAALPFQPSTLSTALPVSRGGTLAGGASAKSIQPTHALPSRPTRAPIGTGAAPATGVRLPSRPSTLRSVTGPISNLEEGELGGEEEGEVNEGARGIKRPSSPADLDRVRSMRTRK